MFTNIIILTVYIYSLYIMYYMCCFVLFVCLTLLASFFLPSHLSFSMHEWKLMLCCLFPDRRLFKLLVREMVSRFYR